jgi:hypothetical protein
MPGQAYFFSSLKGNSRVAFCNYARSPFLKLYYTEKFVGHRTYRGVLLKQLIRILVWM